MYRDRANVAQILISATSRRRPHGTKLTSLSAALEALDCEIRLSFHDPKVSDGFAGPTTLSCTIRLTDSNSDDPVKVSVRGLIVFFR